MSLDRKELYEIVDQVVEMLVEKNRLYGDSYYKLRNEYGKVSFLIRLTDKFNRLKALNKLKKEDEEIDMDTVIDIIGYCVLELYYRRMKKRLEEIKEFDNKEEV